MTQLSFGSGNLIGTAFTDAYGNALAAPQPVSFGVLQNVSLDLSFDLKELYGQGQFPVAVARGKGKIAGKAAFAQLNGLTMNSLFFGQTFASSILGDVIDTAGSAIPASSPYTINTTPPNTGTWTADLGVRDANGVPMIRVVSSPTRGQYSVSNSGVYTFSTLDAGATAYVSYQYTAAGGNNNKSKTSTIANIPMGSAPTFRADLMLAYGGKQIIFTLPNCISSKLSMASKLDDFTMPDFEFAGFADAFGNVLTWGTAE